MAFDAKAKEGTDQKVAEEDPKVIKFVKKNDEFELTYFPILIIFCLNVITGTSKAFSLINFLFTLTIVFLFNILKVHRQCTAHKCVNAVLDNLYLVMVFFGILNVWGAFPVGMPYIVRAS